MTPPFEKTGGRAAAAVLHGEVVGDAITANHADVPSWALAAAAVPWALAVAAVRASTHIQTLSISFLLISSMNCAYGLTTRTCSVAENDPLVMVRGTLAPGCTNVRSPGFHLVNAREPRHQLSPRSPSCFGFHSAIVGETFTTAGGLDGAAVPGAGCGVVAPSPSDRCNARIRCESGW